MKALIMVMAMLFAVAAAHARRLGFARRGQFSGRGRCKYGRSTLHTMPPDVKKRPFDGASGLGEKLSGAFGPAAAFDASQSEREMVKVWPGQPYSRHKEERTSP